MTIVLHKSFTEIWRSAIVQFTLAEEDAKVIGA